MKTFILKWNPGFSNFKKADFEQLIEWGEFNLNWSVWEYEQVEVGDRFFMVRVGEGNTGIVMAGTIISKPSQAADWSGKGRRTFYVDLDVEDIVDSDCQPYVSVERLEKELPGFEWARGHSGLVLPADLAAKLETLWQSYLDNELYGE